MVANILTAVRKIFKDRKNFVVLVLLLGILFLGNKLREVNYATVPPPGENADEYAYAWIGLSILDGKPPRAWSAFPAAYPKVDLEVINVDNIFTVDNNRGPFELVEPWYDSPPLTGLLVSSFARLKGIRNFNDASVIITRRPMLKIAVVTTILIFVLGTILWGRVVGLSSALIYSVSPVFVMATRLVLPENSYVPLFVGLIICMVMYFRSGKIGYWLAGCVLGVIAFFFKFSGISLLLALSVSALIFGTKDRIKLIKYTGIAVAATLLLFIGYGLLYDWQTFVNVFVAQSTRFYGASSEAFFQAFTASKVTKNLTDGWLNLGWISLFIVSFVNWTRKEIGPKVLIVSFFSYLVIFLLQGSEAYGHYRVPFYPIMAIASAKVLVDLVTSSNIAVFVPLMLLPFGTAFHRLVGVVGFQEYVSYFRYSIIASLGILLLGAANKRWVRKVQIVFMLLVIGLVIFISIKEIYFYNIDKWYFVN